MLNNTSGSMKNFFTGFFLLVIYCMAGAQEPSLYFEKINIQNGLSHNKVNCVLQDRRGFIWIGTDDGLNRYDGKNFITFRNLPGDTTTISGNIITGILEDENETMWIATADGGLSSYRYQLSPDHQFKQFRNQPGDPYSIPGNIINDLLDDKHGNLWIATGGHNIVKFDKEKQTFATPVSKSSRRTILSLCLDEKGNIWAGREGGGLLKMNPLSMKYEEDKRYENLYAKLPHAAVTSLFKDHQDNIWYGSWDKVLYRYNSKKNKEEVFQTTLSPHSFINDEISCFAQDMQGRLWMGGKESGLQVYDLPSGHFYNYKYDPSKEGALADNHVNCIYIDVSGRVWIGTDKGISVSIPFKRQFMQTFLHKLPNNSAQKLILYDYYEDDHSQLWIGTSEGVFIKEKDGALIHKPLFYKGSKLSVTHFFRDDSDRLYIGTDYSLFKYNTATGLLSVLPDKNNDRVMNHIIDSRVVSVLKDTINNRPVLLVSPYGHYIAYYDMVEKKWVSRLDTTEKILERFQLKDHLIKEFVKTKDGTIWLANTRLGLGMWEKDRKAIIYFTNLPGKQETIANNTISDIKEDNKGNLWVSTYGGGLHYFDTKKKIFQHISASNNLVEGLQTDYHGNVWMISNGNLQKYDPRTNAFTNYELPDIEKSGGVKGNIFKDAAGTMYVSGDNYFISFHPDSIRGRQPLPKVYFTNFSIFSNSFSHLLYRQPITLSYKQNYFTIEFAAPDYASASEVSYSYRLEGFDNDWIDLGARNFVSYSNLDGGQYTFKVRATNRPGVWDINYAILKISVTPPFWKRGWFYIFCAAFISGMVYAVYRYRVNEILKRQAIRNRIAQDLHDSVGSTLSSISVYSQVAKIQQEKNNAHELKNVIQKIGITSTEMISEMNDIVWSINPRNDSMEKILQRMESFAKPLLKAKGINFTFQYDSAVHHINLPMEKRKNFYLIFKESINNALKYSFCKKVEVTVKQHNHQLELLVTDDGQGFDVEEMKKLAAKSLSGNGLNNMKRRAAEMNGECLIKSSPGGATLVHLRFPVT